MKTKALKSKIAIFVSIMALFIFTGYVNSQGTKRSTDLVKNTALKNDVFKQIMNNKTLFNDFMTNMMQNSQSMQWMMGNQNMMQYMFSGKHLGYMMHNQGMSQMMMQSMMNTIHSDSSFYREWNQMMMNYGRGGHMHQGMMMMRN